MDVVDGEVPNTESYRRSSDVSQHCVRDSIVLARKAKVDGRMKAGGIIFLSVYIIVQHYLSYSLNLHLHSCEFLK